jgi:type 1 fimbriae regulatory protein FimB
VSEACGLELSQVDTESRILHIARLKKGLSTTHPLRGDEIRAAKAWLKERAKIKPESGAFFISERRLPLSRKNGMVCDPHLWRESRACPACSSAMLRHGSGGQPNQEHVQLSPKLKTQNLAAQNHLITIR